jgi:hypothetical protein
MVIAYWVTVAVCAYCSVRNLQLYTEETGAFRTGWVSPNEHANPYSAVGHLDPVLDGPAYRAYVRYRYPEYFS